MYNITSYLFDRRNGRILTDYAIELWNNEIELINDIFISSLEILSVQYECKFSW